MRAAFILSLLSFSYSLFSQNNFAKQLNQIIKDTGNHFQKFKDGVKESIDKESSSYTSTIILEGTRENSVIIHRSICSYIAEIGDSVTKSKGKKILNDWKIKLMSVFGTEYKFAKSKLRIGSQFVVGWYFKKGNFHISVDMSQYFHNKSLYSVRLFIANEHPG